MSRHTALMMVAGLFLGITSSYAQQKEYITFSDTKGKVISCKGAPGFGGSERYGVTLTIKYPTLPAYQKQYAKHNLVLDPDPPKNLTLEQGGFDGPCSKYEIAIAPPIDRAVNNTQPTKADSKPKVLTSLPQEPSTEDGKAALNKLSGYDGFGLFCRNGQTFSALLTKKENGNWVLRKTPQKESCTVDGSKEFIFETVHE